MCYCDDADQPEFFHTTEPKARKPYRCCECRRTIAAGERYVCHTGKWDGDVGVFRWCAHCAEGATIAMGVGACDCYCLGQLWEGIHEGLPLQGDEANAIVVRLIASARRKWTVRRGKRAGQLMPVPRVAAPVEAR